METAAGPAEPSSPARAAPTTGVATGSATGIATGIATVEIVVPVHNEEGDLAPSVRRLRSYLDERFPLSWTITVVDNASTDRTWDIARRLAAELPGVQALHLERKGRGRALRAAWSASPSPVVAYMDVDLSTDLDALLPLVAPLVSGHSDVAIGSRLATSTRVVRGAKREVISRSYNLLLRTSLHAGFSDAQCGFKAVRADVAHTLLPLVSDEGWFFDTELLVLAERHGLRIHEVPVDWVDDPDSRVDVLATARADLLGVLRMLRSPRRTPSPVPAATPGSGAALLPGPSAGSDPGIDVSTGLATGPHASPAAGAGPRSPFGAGAGAERRIGVDPGVDAGPRPRVGASAGAERGVQVDPGVGSGVATADRFGTAASPAGLLPRAPAPGSLPDQLARFVSIGVVSTVVFGLLLASLFGPLGWVAATVVALAACSIANTTANRRLTFAVRGSHRRGRQLRDGLVLAGLPLATTLAAVAVTGGLPDAARVVVVTSAGGLSALIRFVLLRRWVFR